MLGQPTETETYLGFNADDGQSRAIIASVGCLRAWDHGREQNWSKLHPGRRFYNIFALTATKEIYPSIIKHIIASPSLVYFVTISPLNRQEKSYIPIQSAILFSTCLEPCQRSSPGIRRGLGDKRRPHQIRHRRQGNLQDFLTATNSTRKKRKTRRKERNGQDKEGMGRKSESCNWGCFSFWASFTFFEYWYWPMSKTWGSTSHVQPLRLLLCVWTWWFSHQKSLFIHMSSHYFCVADW